MDLLITKFESLEENLIDLMTTDYREYIENIRIASPKPTTFKVELKNGQIFSLIYDPKSYIAKISGKKYYLVALDEFERAIKALSNLMSMGKIDASNISNGEQSAKKPGGDVNLPSGGGELDKLLNEPENEAKPETDQPEEETPSPEETPEETPKELKEYIKKQVMNMLNEAEEDNSRFKEDNSIFLQLGNREDYLKAKTSLDEPKNYGKLAVNFLNWDPKLKKYMLDYFGPSIPTQKSNAEKARGSKFPIKTGDNIIAAIYEFYKSEKSGSLLPYETDIKNNTLIFHKNEEFSIEHIKNIISTVMKNSQIKHKLSLGKKS
jgi:hypothetical protein